MVSERELKQANERIEELQLRLADANFKLDKSDNLREAVGMLTTLHPTMEMDVDHPMAMAEKIVKHVESTSEMLREKLRDFCRWSEKLASYAGSQWADDNDLSQETHWLNVTRNEVLTTLTPRTASSDIWWTLRNAENVGKITALEHAMADMQETYQKRISILRKALEVQKCYCSYLETGKLQQCARCEALIGLVDEWMVKHDAEKDQRINELTTALNATHSNFLKTVERRNKEYGKLQDLFSAMALHLERIIGEHNAPSDCYSTGPSTGNVIVDHVACPSCSAIQFLADYSAAILATRDAAKIAEGRKAGLLKAANRAENHRSGCASAEGLREMAEEAPDA